MEPLRPKWVLGQKWVVDLHTATPGLIGDGKPIPTTVGFYFTVVGVPGENADFYAIRCTFDRCSEVYFLILDRRDFSLLEIRKTEANRRHMTPEEAERTTIGLESAKTVSHARGHLPTIGYLGMYSLPFGVFSPDRVDESIEVNLSDRIRIAQKVQQGNDGNSWNVSIERVELQLDRKGELKPESQVFSLIWKPDLPWWSLATDEMRKDRVRYELRSSGEARQ
jgi:hypothetical protein